MICSQEKLRHRLLKLLQKRLKLQEHAAVKYEMVGWRGAVKAAPDFTVSGLCQARTDQLLVRKRGEEAGSVFSRLVETEKQKRKDKTDILNQILQEEARGFSQRNPSCLNTTNREV